MIPKPLIVVFLLASVVGGIIYFEDSMPEPILIEKPPLVQEDRDSDVKDVRDSPDILFKKKLYLEAPEFVGIDRWINSGPLSIKDLRGKVVLIDFWTYTCINCIRTFPFINEWNVKYKDKGLVIIGVHTPEFKFEEKYENVVEAMQRYGLEYVVAQDNDYATWKAYKNRFWPRKYLIDKDGFIRYDHIGEGAYDETEKMIQILLSELGEEVSGNVSSLEDKTPQLDMTPELYGGFEFMLSRLQSIGNPERLHPLEVFDYTLPRNLRRNVLYLEGKWNSTREQLITASDAGLFLPFTAHSVNIVADGDVELEVKINGKYISSSQAGSDVVFDNGRAYVVVDEARLYNLVDGEYGDYLLTLRTSEGFAFNAFTFG